MAHSVEYILSIAAKNTAVIDKTAAKTEHLTKKTNGANAALKKLGGVAAAYIGISKVVGYLNASVAAYEEEMVAVAKLGQVMRNTMKATDDQIASINELASAQQKLGVVGDETQLAGAQELATYLTKTEHLQKLMPVMNDMLAQQYGMNASQEQAVAVAQMMGKVLDGQVGALSRYGYRFDEATEKVLKYGDEQQRVAALSQVITKYVGGVNAALAATPEGKLKQAANRMGDVQERVGGMWIAIKSAFLPAVENMGSWIEQLVNWFEARREKILGAVRFMATGIIAVFNVVATGVTIVINVLYGIISAVQSAAGVIVPILAAVGAYFVIANAQFVLFAIKFYAYIAATKLAAIATSAWAAAQAVLNAVMKAFSAHPVIAALTAIIALVMVGIALYKKFNAQHNMTARLTGEVSAKIGMEQREMNKLFDALKKTRPESEERKRLLQEMNDKYPDFLDNQNLEAANELEIEKARKKANDELARSVMLKSLGDKKKEAAEKITAAQQKVWNSVSQLNEKFKGVDGFVPYTDERINDALNKIETVVQQKIDSGEFRSGVFSGASNKLISGVLDEVFTRVSTPEEAIKYADDLANTGVNWYGLVDTMLENQQGVKVLTNFAKGRFGMTDEDLAGLGVTAPPGGATGGTGSGGAELKTTTEGIVTGGSKSTNITINIGEVVGKMTFNNEFKENVENMRDQVLDALLRVINMSQSAAA